jgi:hypothetical protein
MRLLRAVGIISTLMTGHIGSALPVAPVHVLNQLRCMHHLDIPELCCTVFSVQMHTMAQLITHH